MSRIGGIHLVWTAVSGKSAIFKQLQLIANNLANLNTTGFRAERARFEKAMDESAPLRQAIASELDQPSSLRPDEYVKANGSFTDLKQGAVSKTGNALDMAIVGEGFFVLQTPDGPRYTRAGNFLTDASGRLVSFEGHPVQGEGGEIQITAGNLSTSADGRISINGQNVGQIQLVQIAADDLLREEGQKFRLKEGASVAPVQNVQIEGGALEESNVNAVQELTDMIFAQRLFEALEKTSESSSKMSRARNEVFGRQSV